MTEIRKDEYLDPVDGLIHCRKCGGPRQAVIPDPFKGGSFKPRCVCSCQQEAERRRREAEERRQRMERIKRRKARDFKTVTSTATPSPTITAKIRQWRKPTHTLTIGPRRSNGTSDCCCSVTWGLENPSRPGASQTPFLIGMYLYS